MKKQTCRDGITLMEVILALAIFVGSLVVISRLVGVGTRAIEQARLESIASLLAESKMGEVESGIVPVSESGAQFVERPEWQWEISTSDGAVAGLKQIQITVWPSPQGPLARFADSFRFQLDRWLLVDTADSDQPSRTRASITGVSP